MYTNENGLNEEEVIINRKKYGTNDLGFVKENKFISLLLESLGDPIIKILLVALSIKVIFLFKSFDWYETLGILIAIFTASLISSLSEYGSAKAFIKLQKEFLNIKAKVKRDGVVKEVSCNDIVVGDIVFLSSGDQVPADGYLIEGDLSLDESPLNGETVEVYKSFAYNSNFITDDNKVYRGSSVYGGNAVIRVTGVGKDTFYGRMASELCDDNGDSPLKERLRNLANIISRIGYVGAFFVAFSYLFSVIVINNNFDIGLIKNTVMNFPVMMDYLLYALTLCVTIIVVAVPEGLPMMITLVLSSNMKRMLKDNVLVRKLVGIETAGNLNILFTDKTGTLTKGKMEVVGVMDDTGRVFSSESDLIQYKDYYNRVKINMLLNNESVIDVETKVPIGGNTTDRAILSFFKFDDKWMYKKIASVPFDSKRKYSIVKINDSLQTNLIKGAAEVILDKCSYSLDKFGRRNKSNGFYLIKRRIDEYTKDGIRVIVIAESSSLDISKLDGLCFVGAILIKDEVRPEAIEGVKLVQGAGIQTVMVTGDSKNTALAVAREVGIVKSDKDLAYTGKELAVLSDEEIKALLPNIKVIARSLPQDKSRLVRIAQASNLVVGMTGDGVNDAPALKHADVGFSMGSGMEVAKEASDIVILDNNFMSISKAILFGRTIFKSIRKFVVVQLTINMCAISLSIICPFIGIDTPVTVVQMLWVNMVMDTLAGLAFAFEPPLLEYMKEHPLKREEMIINKYMFSQIIVLGLYSAILSIFFLKSNWIFENIFNGSTLHLMTAFFGLFIFIDIFNSFNARTMRINILSNLRRNKVFIVIMLFVVIVQIILIYKGGTVFRTSGLNLKEFIFTLILSFTVVPVDWIRKKIVKKIWVDAKV